MLEATRIGNYCRIGQKRCVRALALVGALVATGSVATAQELPETMVGTWAEGSCDQSSRVRILNSFGVLDFLTINNQTHLHMLVFEGIVPGSDGSVNATLVRPTVHDTIDYTFALQDDRLDGAFVRCRQAPPLVLWPFGEMIAAFEALGAIKVACVAGDSPGCLREAFDYADVTGDGELTVAEISRVLRAVGFLIGYLSQSSPIMPAKELATPAAVAGLAGPFVVSSVVDGMDYDASGALSIEELLQDRGDLAGLAAAASALEPAAMQTMLQAAFAALPGLLQMLPF